MFQLARFGFCIISYCAKYRIALQIIPKSNNSYIQLIFRRFPTWDNYAELMFFDVLHYYSVKKFSKLRKSDEGATTYLSLVYFRIPRVNFFQKDFKIRKAK